MHGRVVVKGQHDGWSVKRSFILEPGRAGSGFVASREFVSSLTKTTEEKFGLGEE